MHQNQYLGCTFLAIDDILLQDLGKRRFSNIEISFSEKVPLFGTNFFTLIVNSMAQRDLPSPESSFSVFSGGLKHNAIQPGNLPGSARTSWTQATLPKGCFVRSFTARNGFLQTHLRFCLTSGTWKDPVRILRIPLPWGDGRKTIFGYLLPQCT